MDYLIVELVILNIPITIIVDRLMVHDYPFQPVLLQCRNQNGAEWDEKCPHQTQSTREGAHESYKITRDTWRSLNKY